jgi:hypothetical protein
MNNSSLRSDLSEYADRLWQGRRIIVLITASCVIVMAAFTWGMPRLYLVTSQVNAGSLGYVHPLEVRLFVEAVDRNRFHVEGGTFSETAPKVLRVTNRDPSTIDLKALSPDPAGALQRLTVLTAAVQAELQVRLTAYAEDRVRVLATAAASSQRAIDLIRTLRTKLRERGFAANSLIESSRAAATGAAARRAGLQSSADVRFRPLLLKYRADAIGAGPSAGTTGAETAAAVDEILAALVRDADASQPASTLAMLQRNGRRVQALARIGPVGEAALSDLRRVFREVSAEDGQVARAVTQQKDVESMRLRDERLLPALEVLVASSQDAEIRLKVYEDAELQRPKNQRSPPPPANAFLTSQDVEKLRRVLDDAEHSYDNADDPIAPAVQETRAAVASLVVALHGAEGARARPVLTPPFVSAAPVLFPKAVWPRPLVNVAIAFLFGLVASVILATFVPRNAENQL